MKPVKISIESANGRDADISKYVVGFSAPAIEVPETVISGFPTMTSEVNGAVAICLFDFSKNRDEWLSITPGENRLKFVERRL